MSEALTPEQADEVTRLYFEIFNAHDRARFHEIVASDYVGHTRMGRLEGLEAFSAMISNFIEAVPDVHWSLLDERRDGDRIIYLYEVTGTHQGELMGVPGTGLELRFTGMEMNRVANGKLAETWNYVDLMSVLGQIGALPGPA